MRSSDARNEQYNTIQRYNIRLATEICTQLQGSRINGWPKATPIDAVSTVCAEAHLGVHRGGGARMGYLQEDEYQEASGSNFFTQQSLRVPLSSPLGCRIGAHPTVVQA